MLYPDHTTAILFTIFYIVFLFVAAILLAPVERPLGVPPVSDKENQDEEEHEVHHN